MKRIITLLLTCIFISLSIPKNSLGKNFNNNSTNELSKNFIQVDGQNSYGVWDDFYGIIHCFKIKFNTVSQRIVTEKITNEYFSNYIGYNEFLNIKILDKLSKEKLNLSLTGWDYFSSGKVEKLNNFKYEYGDIIKISGKILERQSIGGRVIGATRDYSKGLNNIDDMDNLGFEITPNGLKEIRNKAPIIKNIDSIKLIKNNNFNALRNVVAIDDLDGDITDKVIVEGFIDTTRVGEYTLKYNVKDSWNKVTENIRKITVIENPKLNENIIKVNGDFSSFGEERFNIEFDDLNKKLKIRTDLIQIKGSNSEKLIFNPKLSTKDKDKKYFYIEIFDKTRKSKVLVELKGDDDATSYKLNPLKGFKYEYGDIIKFWHRHADILEICGDVIDRKESYLDGIQNNIEEVQFEITKNGLKAIYNKAPIIRGVKDINIKIGEKFNPLSEIKVEDDHDKNLIPKVIGNVDINKLGAYELQYYVKDSWGAESRIKRKIIVRSNNNPKITSKNENITIEQDTEVNNKYLLNLINAKDDEDGNLINKVKVTSNINSKNPGVYGVEYSVVDSDGNSFSLKKEVAVVRSIKVSVPVKIGFQIATNVVGKKFIVADYKIINHKQSAVKVYVNSFRKEEGDIDIVSPYTFSNWDNIGQVDSMGNLALGLYVKNGFEKNSYNINTPLWLNNNMKNRSYLGEISGGLNSKGIFSFVAKHGENFFGEKSQGKYLLTLEFE